MTRPSGGGIPGDADETDVMAADETLIGPGEGWEPVPVGKDGEDEEDDGEPVVALLGREIPRRRVYVAAGLAAVLLLTAVGGGIALSASGGSADGGNQNTAPVVSQAAAEEKEESRVLEIGVAAEGWDEATSSPVIAHIESADGEVDFYHAYAANKAESVDVGDKASCKVTLISPVNADGSIYRVGESKTLQSSEKGAAAAKTAEARASSSTVITIEKVDAGSVTAGDLTAIAGQVTEAVKKGDSTLTGDAGSKVVSKVEGNIKNSPSATDDVKQSVEQQAGQAQEEAKKEETSAKVPAASGSSSSGSVSSSGSAQGGSGNTQSASSGSASGGQSQGSGSSSGGSSSGSSQGGSGNTQSASSGSASDDKSQGSGSSSGGNASQGSSGSSTQQGGSQTGGGAGHEHSWNYHPTETKVIHHEAMTHQETVYHDAVTHKEWYAVCNGCGYSVTDDNIDSLYSHMEEQILAGNYACGGWHEDYVTVTDQAAWDETVTVTDQAAWDETVIVKQAYYSCSCGASK